KRRGGNDGYDEGSGRGGALRSCDGAREQQGGTGADRLQRRRQSESGFPRAFGRTLRTILESGMLRRLSRRPRGGAAACSARPRPGKSIGKRAAPGRTSSICDLSKNLSEGQPMRTWNRPAIVVTLSAAAILMVTMGARQSLGLFVSPLNGSTGLGIATISLAL